MSTNIDSRNKMSISDAFNEYYQLKNKYESNFNKEKQKIIKNKGLSWREKKQEYKKLKPKCINCRRPVGTIFSVKYLGKENEDTRELKAICGSLTQPCNLNITINPGVTYNLMKHIQELEKDKETYKNEIIDYKNKLLFGYTSTENAVEKFDKTKDAINDINFLLNFNYEHLFEITNNKMENDNMKKLQEEIYIYIQNIKQYVQDFNTTSNLQFVRDAVDIYENQMKMKLQELMSLKYKVNMVEFDEYDKKYHLIQKKYGIATLEDNYVEPEVISFVYGDVNVMEGKMSKKYKSNIVKGKEGKEGNEGIEPLVSSKVPVPILNEDGSISWENADYQNLWIRLPIRYREILTSKGNKEWLMETMNKYVALKNANKPLVFAAPSNLILPPLLLEDGSYDFGNDEYNKIFNKLDKSYQRTLLTLYTEKDGKKDYNMLLDTLNSMVKQDLGFTEYL